MKLKINIDTIISVDKDDRKYCGDCQWAQNIYGGDLKPVCGLFHKFLKYNTKENKMLRCKKCRRAGNVSEAIKNT